jgi:hypothetical protein
MSGNRMQRIPQWAQCVKKVASRQHLAKENKERFFRPLRGLEDDIVVAFETLRVGLAAGFVFAAGARTIRLIDEDVVVTGRADDAVDRFAELFVSRGCSVLRASLLAADGHRYSFQSGDPAKR